MSQLARREFIARTAVGAAIAVAAPGSLFTAVSPASPREPRSASPRPRSR